MAVLQADFVGTYHARVIAGMGTSGKQPPLIFLGGLRRSLLQAPLHRNDLPKLCLNPSDLGF